MLPVQFTIYILTSISVYLLICYVKLVYFLDTSLHQFYFGFRDGMEYDYIVVGAGSAGAILAAKLANKGFSTLLLEAGGIAPPFLDIPLLAPLIQGTPYDWEYVTVPQSQACKALINNQSKWPSGKVLGGSSRLNYMVYVRGHPSDYDGWFPDFIEPTKNEGGPMRVSDLRWDTGLGDAVVKGAAAMGYHNVDINKDFNTGFMKARLAMENGRRWSSDRLLYENSKDTLTVITHARTNKVLVDSGKAVGVHFNKLGSSHDAIAKKGVILCAGAVGSPKLLMLSGIGPKKHLEQLKIKVINNLPVGQNLVDHILTGVDLVTLNVSLPLNLMDGLNPLSALNYFAQGKGPWTASGIEALGTFHSNSQKNTSNAPNIQLMILPLGISKDNGIVLRKAMGILDKVYDKYFVPLTNKNAITIAPVLLHPKSKGEIKLRNSNPTEDPLIDPKYLSNKEDIATLVEGLQFVERLVKTDAMQSLGAQLHKKPFPGCEDKAFATTDYWECYIRHLTLTSYHPAGTCRMGDVVDTSFRVYNMKNLYVVDASVLPSLPSGNINAAVIMLAEKAARILTRCTKLTLNDILCHNSDKYCETLNVCTDR